jgi:hypothetical protein
MDMATNITDASAIPMAPTTQQVPAITITSVNSVALAIPEGIHLDSAISA